jgi:excisionase family DNA binding protein
VIGGRLFTLAEAADELRCSLATVKRRVAAGELAVFHDGRLVRVREDDLQRYVAERVARRSSRAASVVVAGRTLARGARLWD